MLTLDARALLENEELAGVVVGDPIQSDPLLHSMVQNEEVLQQEQGVGLLLRHLEAGEEGVEGSLGLNLWVQAFEGADKH